MYQSNSLVLFEFRIRLVFGAWCLEFPPKGAEVAKILRRLKENLQKFGLELSMEKTSFIPFGKNTFEGKNNDSTFDFLGFTFLNDRSSDGTYKVGKLPIKKS